MSLLKTENTDFDGKIVSCGRDTPGQHSFYIRPGEPEREVYRLSTFENFPTHSPANPCQLAAAGFFFTGYKDRVKCFSCAHTIEDWCSADDPLSARWHRNDCSFIRRTDNSNVPITTIFENIQQEAASTNFNNSPFLPSQPRTQPPSSSIASSSVSAAVINANLEATAASTPPSNRFVIESPVNTETPGHSTSATASAVVRELNQAFPCTNPVNPHMRNLETRLQTFRDRADIWPAHRIAATPEQMAQAGLYFLGDRDRVKCWYCNGGLQNWDKFDNPWFEHAKWFPTCEYVLQKKGPEFVHNVVERFPNLNRPEPVNLAGPFVASRFRDPSSSNRHPQVIDPQEQRRSLERKVDEEIQTSSLVEDALLMGFSNEEIRCAMIKRFRQHGSTFPTFANLVENVIAAQETNLLNEAPGGDITNVAAPSTSASTSATSSVSQRETWKQEFEQLSRIRLCKVCYQSKASVVFLPCGHLATCSECSRKTSRCPLCKMTVEETIHSYIV